MNAPEARPALPRQPESDELATLLLMLNAAPMGFAQLALDGRVELANSAIVRLLMPLAHDGRIGNLFEVLRPMVPGLRERVRAHQAERGLVCEGLRLAVGGPDGDRHLAVTLMKIDRARLLMTLTDISSEVRAELAMREREARLRLTLAATRIAACEFDLDRDCVRPSAGMQRLLGGSGPLPQWTLADFFEQVHEADRAAARSGFDQAARDGQTWQTEFRMHGLDGRWRWLSARGQMLDMIQATPMLLCLLMDVTAEREAGAAKARARALEEENRLIQQASALKTHFLVALAHKLRTPLTSIVGFAELIATKSNQPAQCHQARLILDNAGHLQTLIDETIDLAALDADCMPLAPAPVPLTPLLQRVAAAHAEAARERGLTLALTLQPSLPAQLVCDEQRLTQVLSHLLSNAVKFTVEGTVHLRAQGELEAVLFEVEDTGPGIAPEFHDSVFERFHQAEGLANHEHGGTGLGLALARGLARAMGGSLALQSRPGEGARFTLRLPQA